MNILNIFDTPLEGINLIEASAGTGKTYTLSLFALRFIVEKGYSIDEFLVVTYTRAATAELKERISLFLNAAGDYFYTGVCDNGEIKKILESAIEKEGEDLVRSRVEQALLRSDESQIFTIHSFCGRVLSEFAFETGQTFDVEIIEDQAPMLQESVDDFWRSYMSTLSPLTLSLIEGDFSLDSAYSLIHKITNFPLLRVESQAVSEVAIEQQWRLLSEKWTLYKAELFTLLSEDKGLGRKAGFYKHDDLPKLFDDVESAFSIGLYSKRLLLFSEREIEKQLKKGKVAPVHPFFEMVADFEALRENYIGHLKELLIGNTKELLKSKKEKQGVQSRDDLITSLYVALRKKESNALVAAVSGRYKAALVDEFQDTDRVQFSIFFQLFSRVTLFMIGDPKQAIYKFRGGDIDAYLYAAQKADSRYTLKTNYRSEAGVISVINDIFTVENPFLYEEISYEKKIAGAKILPLQQMGNSLPPVTLWQDVDKKTMWDHFAEEVIRLIENRTEVVSEDISRPLMLSDMAVLVSKNREAQEVKSALQKRGIQSVVSKSGSIFKSYEARKIYLLLKLFSEPAKESLNRAILVSKFFKKNYAEIEELVHSDQQWAEWLALIYEGRDNIALQGVSFAVDTFLRKSGVFAILLASPEGERSVTNIRHLLEILHHKELECGREVELLLHYLSDQIQEESSSSEHELRLESEGDAVTIMTVHKSKGLQFPVVFYGLRGNSRKAKDAHPIIAGDDGMVLDLRSEMTERVQERAQFEENAEEFRTFYVAVTRAEYKLYLAMVAPPKKGYDAYSPEAKFLYGRSFSESLIHIATPPDCRLVHLRKQGDKAIGRACTFPQNRRITLLNQVRSYTGLTRGTTTHTSIEVPENASGIFAFPRGAKAGTALHEIFEEIDFSSVHKREHIASTVKKILDKYNFGQEDSSPVEDMVQAVMQKDLGGFSLMHIPRIDRVTEIEFYMRAQKIDEHFLQSILGDSVGTISKSSIDSFLNGFIDLLFRVNGRYYILDWKSNYLGGTAKEYNLPALSSAMLEHNYHLQYLIYTAAVVQLLKKKSDSFDYETDFGGVYYIFLRGVEAGDSQNGIYYRKPKWETIQALLEHFTGEDR